MPLQRRLPKRGFKNAFRKVYDVINVEDLMKFEPNTSVDADALRNRGMIRKNSDGVKLLGRGQMKHPVVVKIHRASKSAREKVEAAGGKIEII